MRCCLELQVLSTAVLAFCIVVFWSPVGKRECVCFVGLFV